jgi:hypothetical protein
MAQDVTTATPHVSVASTTAMNTGPSKLRYQLSDVGGNDL